MIFGGHDYLERTTGLTYAEYVHQGFGQLTVATALTLLVVWAATRKAPRETPADRAWIRVSLGLLCALTLVVVASALYRMHVYQEAYGFTRLRLLVDVFEGWLGVLVLATMVGGVGAAGGVAAPVRAAQRRGAAARPGRDQPRRLDRPAEPRPLRSHRQGRLALPRRPLRRRPPRARHAAPATSPSARWPSTAAERDDWLEWNLGRSQARDFIETHADDWQYRADCPGQTLD